MNPLSEFFKETSNETGVFYPNHYLVAVFRDFTEAETAQQDLTSAGFLSENVIAVPGEEVVRFAESHLLKDGLWGVLMREVSRSIGTEAAYADRDLAAAKSGAAFVAVRCSDEKLKDKAWRSLEPRRPLAARYYSSGGIEHLTGEL